MDSGLSVMRVGLRLWGFYDFEVEGWLQDLPGSGAKASWEVLRHRDGKGLDMVIHLVRSTSESCGPFCWNCVGANRAMQRSIGSSTTHIALFFGDVRRLPVHRCGLWMLLDGCNERMALHTVAENVVIPLVSYARQSASAAHVAERPTHG
ncbi:hypothetical protein [Paraburkholderia sp. 2C]|jgi:hypothetical protein